MDKIKNQDDMFNNNRKETDQNENNAVQGLQENENGRSSG